jgi:AcrR family transcriptional regulator
MPQATGADTRARLIDAAAELLEEKGYAGASVAEITRRAGITPGALYRHFPAKAELIVEVIREIASAELARMRAAADSAESHTEQLDAVVATAARQALVKPHLAWSLAYEPVDPLVDGARLELRRAYRARMAALLRRGAASGAFTIDDPDITAAAIVGLTFEALVGPLSHATRHGEDSGVTLDRIVVLCRRVAGAGP